MDPDYKIPAAARIGHVHLKVADLQRSLDFYCGLLGFELMQFYGDSAAFISAGGYHHHIGLNTWHSKGAPPAAREGVGLYHTAILYPARKDLALALDEARRTGAPTGQMGRTMELLEELIDRGFGSQDMGYVVEAARRRG